MTTMILIRHGETTGNVEAVWHGRLDAPLTERGQLQVASTARRMEEIARVRPVTAFYVSPLGRARSTAEAIAAPLGLSPIVEAGLGEFDLGDWEGRSFADLRDQENLWSKWKTDPSFAPPNGESPVSFAQRVVATFRDISEQHSGQTVAIVTHGGVLSNLLAIWLGKSPADWRRWEPHNCAITILEGTDDSWEGVLVNDTGHLPPEAVIARTVEAWDQ